LISPQNGEFVHDGEHDKLQKYEQQLKAIGKSPNKREEIFVVSRNPDLFSPSLENQNLKSATERDRLDTSRIVSVHLDLEEAPYICFESKVVCIFCGEITQNWWWYDNPTNTCKCKPCREKGKS
jgi:hypothetical protein